MNKENAKRQIKELIDKYNKVVEEKRVSKYNEEMTKKDFILPLFRALGWNVEDSLEVTAEEKISEKRVDYGFRIDNIPRFFLEAKALKTDLSDSKFIRQAINYAWWRTCNWAVLTDFQNIMVFNCQWKADNLLQNLLRSISCQDFLNRFEELWLLSRESFEKGLIDALAEKEYKKAKPVLVGEQLLDDLTRWRNTLSKNIQDYNKEEKLTENQLDETVQRLLNRLVFIRKAEDSGLEEKVLQQALRRWETNDTKALYILLREIFKIFRKMYDSELFDEALADQVIITNDVLKDVINGLYGTKDKLREYNFAKIDADVLGNVYEQYLGHILKKTKKRVDVKENHAHRKEQGIYYTPTYIVDYIVRNTLGELLKDKKVDVEKIRVLDPACGSGSFLIKAFDVLNEHCSKHDKDYAQTQIDTTCQGSTFTVKTKILRDNIFGVDLDKQAVEIARLNLLLKIAEKEQRLPILRQNIKRGNSLIDDEKVAGDVAFKWEQEFKQIMDEGGFDVVIGNPPYVRQEELLPIKPYLQSHSKVYHSMADLFVYFFEREFKLLKEGGYFGMIVSNKWLKASYALNLRRFLSKYWIELFIDFGDLPVFQDATTYPCILLMRKSTKQNSKIKVCQVNTLKFESLEKYIRQNQFFVDQNELDEHGWNFYNSENSRILEKIRKNGIPLKEYVKGKIYYGIKTGLNDAFIIDAQTRERLISKDKKSADLIKPFIAGRDIKRYAPLKSDKFLIFIPNGWTRTQLKGHSDAWRWFMQSYPAIADYLKSYEKKAIERYDKGEYWWELRPCEYYKEFEKPKIMLPDISTRGNFALDTYDYFYCVNTAYIISSSDKFLLGILNSKLITFFYKSISQEIRGGYLRFIFQYFAQLPIFPKEKATLLVHDIENFVDKMLSLNKRLNEIGDKKTDDSYRIGEEIKKTDAETDKLVYKLYGITEEEKKIIEESLK